MPFASYIAQFVLWGKRSLIVGFWNRRGYGFGISLFVTNLVDLWYWNTLVAMQTLRIIPPNYYHQRSLVMKNIASFEPSHIIPYQLRWVICIKEIPCISWPIWAHEFEFWDGSNEKTSLDEPWGIVHLMGDAYVLRQSFNRMSSPLLQLFVGPHMDKNAGKTGKQNGGGEWISIVSKGRETRN